MSSSQTESANCHFPFSGHTRLILKLNNYFYCLESKVPNIEMSNHQFLQLIFNVFVYFSDP